MPRRGSQKPTFQKVGEYAYSDGENAVNLFEEYGVKFLPAQKYEMELFLARDIRNEVAAMIIAISKPRQNGKSFAARFYAIWMACIEGKKVLYTAHHGKTVRKMFQAIRTFVESNPDFAECLKPGNEGIYRAEGREAVQFVNGGLIEFATRTISGGRGETYDIIIVDEAQELTDEQFEALTPTQIAAESGDPQIIYIGTPPNAKCPGTIFRSLHDKAHAGTGGAWWLEWAAAQLGDVHDKDLWYETNPNLGYRIREKTFASAADQAHSVDGFFREYLGWWSKAEKRVDAALDTDAWSECSTGKPPGQGVLSCGIKFSLDGKLAALSVCLNPGAGEKMHIETICVRSTLRGVGWISRWIIERRHKLAQVTIDGKAKADVLEKSLSDAKCPKKQIVVAKAADITTACSMLEEAVSSRVITHFAQPGLDESVTTSTKRAVGKNGGWAFDGELALPVESAALAYWGARTTKRNPNRKARVG